MTGRVGAVHDVRVIATVVIAAVLLYAGVELWRWARARRALRRACPWCRQRIEPGIDSWCVLQGRAFHGECADFLLGRERTW